MNNDQFFYKTSLAQLELKNDREEEEEETLAALRLFEGGDNLGSLKLWKKNLNREATIIINPVATGNIYGFVECGICIRFVLHVHLI
jgi:hypothetical protein